MRLRDIMLNFISIIPFANVMLRKLKKWLANHSHIRLLQTSDLFDVEYYLSQNPDVAESGMDAISHFVKFGWREGRNPSRKFSIASYLYEYDDVLKADVNPLVHYILHGKSEGRNAVFQFQNFSRNRLPLYDCWLEVNQFNHRRKSELLNALAQAREVPKLSIIMPVYNPELSFLEEAIQSILQQVHENWELCICEDCSTNTEIVTYLNFWAKKDKRIKVTFHSKNQHISAATNSAANIADGDFFVLMDQDDMLEPDALAELALYMSKNPTTDIVYTDDDKINEVGKRFAPQFKPAWSPELLLSHMYFGHIFCLRRELYQQVGGMRVGYEGSQDYDLALRASEVARHIGHVPRILYNWRAIPGSTAMGGTEKAYSFATGIKALRDALQRRQLDCEVFHPQWSLKNGNGVYSLRFPNTGPSVAIIIPSYNQKRLLESCITSLEKTSYRNYKIYIIDNESDEPEFIAYLKKLPYTVFKISNPEGHFNFAYINNRAVEKVTEDYILFLNNDTKVIEENWLSQMVGYFGISGVGAVGARLIFQDGRIQHAGVVHNMRNGFPVPAFQGCDSGSCGYLSYSKVPKNYLAVTAACMLTPRQLFLELGGFDEKNFPVAYNDCDYCYRLHSAGYRSVFCPGAELYHYEGQSRTPGDSPLEAVAYMQKYGKLQETYYNPNLAKSYATYQMSARTITTRESNISLRILMVTHNLNYEGAPLVLLDIAKGLKSKGKEPIVVSPIDGLLRQEFERQKIEIHVLNEFHMNTANSDSYEEELTRLSQIITPLNIDVVLANTIISWWGIQIANQLGVGSVWVIHESEDPFSHFNGADFIKEKAEKCLEYAYQVVFVSKATKRIFDPWNIRNNFCVITNGFDQNNISRCIQKITREQARSSLELSPEELYVFLPGTVCERKGQIDLVKALNLIPKNLITKIRFSIVGDGPDDQMYSTLLHDEVENLSLERQKRITIHPKTDNILPHYLASDIFVCSSRVESFPRIIQEAMYFGLPIVTTPVFGIQEQLRNNVSALFYEPGNIKDLSKKLQRFINQPNLRKTFGESAKTSLGILPNYEMMISTYTTLLSEAWLSGGRKEDLATSLESSNQPKISNIPLRKVSVIVPNYNYANLLMQRLKSIEQQTYPFHELLILDDCSSDDSMDIIATFQQQTTLNNVKVISNQENSGSVFKQWVKGIELAEGDFIWIAEADDLAEPEFLKYAMHGFSNPEVVLSYTQSKKMQEDGTIQSEDYLHHTNDIHLEKWKSAYTRKGTLELADTLVVRNTIPNVSGTVFRKVDLSSIVQTLTSFKLAGDWFFYSWLLQQGDITFYPKSLNLHRCHSSSVTATLDNKRHYDEIIRVQDYIQGVVNLSEETNALVEKCRIGLKSHLGLD